MPRNHLDELDENVVVLDMRWLIDVVRLGTIRLGQEIEGQASVCVAGERHSLLYSPTSCTGSARSSEFIGSTDSLPNISFVASACH